MPVSKLELFMSSRAFTLTYFIAQVCIMSLLCPATEASVVEAYREEASDLTQKRIEQKTWSGKQQSDFMQRSFPLQQWDLYYSSLGTQKSSIMLEETTSKKRFDSEIITFPSKQRTRSNWNSRLAGLEHQAQIRTDRTVQQIEEKRIYHMILQQSLHYSDTGETLSLREMNRFQFRKNHSDAAVPVQKAGISDDS
jgi:hypothetical protein